MLRKANPMAHGCTHVNNTNTRVRNIVLLLCVQLFLLGDPPSINTTMIEKNTTVPENKRINVGNPVNISSGANLTLDCIVAGSPPITIRWLRNGEVIETSQGNSSNITIAITNTNDGDNITCRAANNNGYNMATTTINVDGNFIMYIISLYIICM